MKITATGGGGFAGLSQHFEVDTEISPAGPALEAALASSGFFASDENFSPRLAPIWGNGLSQPMTAVDDIA